MNAEKETEWEKWLGDVVDRTRKVGQYSHSYLSKNFPDQKKNALLISRERSIQEMGKKALQLTGEYNKYLRAEIEAENQDNIINDIRKRIKQTSKQNNRTKILDRALLSKEGGRVSRGQFRPESRLQSSIAVSMNIAAEKAKFGPGYDSDDERETAPSRGSYLISAGSSKGNADNTTALHSKDKHKLVEDSFTVSDSDSDSEDEDWDTRDWSDIEIRIATDELIKECENSFDVKRQMLAMGMILRIIGLHKVAYDHLLGQMEGLVEKGLRIYSSSNEKASKEMDSLSISRVVHFLANISTVMGEKLSRLNSVGRIMRILRSRYELAARYTQAVWRSHALIKKARSYPADIRLRLKVMQKLKTNAIKEMWRDCYRSSNGGFVESGLVLSLIRILVNLTSDGSSYYIKNNRIKVVYDGGLVCILDWADNNDVLIRECVINLCRNCAQEPSLRLPMLQSNIVNRLLSFTSSKFPVHDCQSVLEVIDLLAESTAGGTEPPSGDLQHQFSPLANVLAGRQDNNNNNNNSNNNNPTVSNSVNVFKTKGRDRILRRKAKLDTEEARRLASEYFDSQVLLWRMLRLLKSPYADVRIAVLLILYKLSCGPMVESVAAASVLYANNKHCITQASSKINITGIASIVASLCSRVRAEASLAVSLLKRLCATNLTRYALKGAQLHNILRPLCDLVDTKGSYQMKRQVKPTTIDATSAELRDHIHPERKSTTTITSSKFNSAPFNSREFRRVGKWNGSADQLFCNKVIIQQLYTAYRYKFKLKELGYLIRVRECKHRDRLIRASNKGKPKWKEAFDPERGLYYYYNVDSNEVSWGKPVSYVMQAHDDIILAVIKIQDVWRNRSRKKWLQGQTKQQEQQQVLSKNNLQKKKHSLKNYNQQFKERLHLSNRLRGGDVTCVWVEGIDDETGYPYYYNTESGECFWEKPQELIDYEYQQQKISKRSYVDDDDDSANESTEITGVLDADVGMSKDINPTSLNKQELLVKKALDGELKKQSDWRRNISNKVTTAQEEVTSKLEIVSEHWVECFDPNADAFYYYSHNSGETTWEKPLEYIMAADDDFMAAVILIQSTWRANRARVTHSNMQAETDYNSNNTEDINPTPLNEQELLVKKALDGELKKQSDWRRNISYKVTTAQKEVTSKLEIVSEHWVECFDPHADAFYYYSHNSGETTWEKPLEYIMAADDDFMAAVILIQSTWRANRARKRCAELILKQRSPPTYMLDEDIKKRVTIAQESRNNNNNNNNWVECFDPQSERYYYYNNNTGETTWDKPESFVLACDDEFMGAIITIQSLYRSKVAKRQYAQLCFEKERLYDKILSDTRIQSQFNEAMQRRAEDERDALEDSEREEVWVEMYDPTSQRFYYYESKETKEVSWIKPEVYIEACEEHFLRCVIKIQSVFRSHLAAKKVSELLLQRHRESHQSFTKTEIELRERAKRSHSEHQKKTLKSSSGGGCDGDFIEVYDTASQSFYYHNKQTGESQWDKPELYIMACDDESLMLAVIRIQSKFRGRVARKIFKALLTGKSKEEINKEKEFENKVYQMKVQRHQEAMMLEKEQLEKGLSKEKWVSVYDPQSDAIYYYESYSEVTSWEKPSHFIIADEDEMMSAVIRIQCAFRTRVARRKVAEMLSASVNTERELKAKLVSETIEKMNKAKIEKSGTLGWKLIYLPSNGKYLYINQDTGARSWSKPVDFEIHDADRKLIKATITVQCAWRRHIARKEHSRRVKLTKMVHRLNKETLDDTNVEDSKDAIDRDSAMQLVTEQESQEIAADIFRNNGKMRNISSFNSDETLCTVESMKLLQNELLSTQSDPWIEAYDTTRERFYYFQHGTGNSIWEKPNEYILAANEPLMKACITIQRLWRGSQSRRKLRFQTNKNELFKSLNPTSEFLENTDIHTLDADRVLDDGAVEEFCISSSSSAASSVDIESEISSDDDSSVDSDNYNDDDFVHNKQSIDTIQNTGLKTPHIGTKSRGPFDDKESTRRASCIVIQGMIFSGHGGAEGDEVIGTRAMVVLVALSNQWNRPRPMYGELNLSARHCDTCEELTSELLQTLTNTNTSPSTITTSATDNNNNSSSSSRVAAFSSLLEMKAISPIIEFLTRSYGSATPVEYDNVTLNNDRIDTLSSTLTTPRTDNTDSLSDLANLSVNGDFSSVASSALSSPTQRCDRFMYTSCFILKHMSTMSIINSKLLHEANTLRYIAFSLRRYIETFTYNQQAFHNMSVQDQGLFLLGMQSCCQTFTLLSTANHLQPSGRQQVGETMIEHDIPHLLSGILVHPSVDVNKHLYNLLVDVCEAAILLVGNVVIPPAYSAYDNSLREKKMFLSHLDHRLHQSFHKSVTEALLCVLGGRYNEIRLISATCYALYKLCAFESFTTEILQIGVIDAINNIFPRPLKLLLSKGSSGLETDQLQPGIIRNKNLKCTSPSRIGFLSGGKQNSQSKKQYVSSPSSSCTQKAQQQQNVLRDTEKHRKHQKSRLLKIPASVWTLCSVLARHPIGKTLVCSSDILKFACERFLLVTSSSSCSTVQDLQAQGEISLLFSHLFGEYIPNWGSCSEYIVRTGVVKRILKITASVDNGSRIRLHALAAINNLAKDLLVGVPILVDINKCVSLITKVAASVSNGYFIRRLGLSILDNIASYPMERYHKQIHKANAMPLLNSLANDFASEVHHNKDHGPSLGFIARTILLKLKTLTEHLRMKEVKVASLVHQDAAKRDLNYDDKNKLKSGSYIGPLLSPELYTLRPRSSHNNINNDDNYIISDNNTSACNIRPQTASQISLKNDFDRSNKSKEIRINKLHDNTSMNIISRNISSAPAAQRYHQIVKKSNDYKICKTKSLLLNPISNNDNYYNDNDIISRDQYYLNDPTFNENYYKSAVAILRQQSENRKGKFFWKDDKFQNPTRVPTAVRDQQRQFILKRNKLHAPNRTLRISPRGEYHHESSNDDMHQKMNLYSLLQESSTPPHLNNSYVVGNSTSSINNHKRWKQETAYNNSTTIDDAIHDHGGGAASTRTRLYLSKEFQHNFTSMGHNIHIEGERSNPIMLASTKAAAISKANSSPLFYGKFLTSKNTPSQLSPPGSDLQRITRKKKKKKT